MADETSQPDSADDSGDTGGAENNNLMDKLRGVFGGKKDYKKMLIASIIILTVGGMIAFMIWGWILALRAMFTGDPSNASYGGICQGAFDRSKRTVYEAASGDDPGPAIAISAAGKKYAIEKLGISEGEMRIFPKEDVENMIRAEVATQFNELGLAQKIPGARVEDAQRALLTYQVHESPAFQLFRKSGIPSYTTEDNPRTIDILSLTKDKFQGSSCSKDGKSYCYNKRIAASYDIHYAIYLGVQEHMNMYKGSACNGSKDDLERWRCTLTKVFASGPFWNSRSEPAWKHYENETPYNCTPGSYGATGDMRGPFVQKIQTGWLAQPGRFRQDMRVSGIVLHYTAGNDVDGAVSTMGSRGSFTHAIIGKDGTVYQLLPFNKRVMSGSGEGNSFAVGIEIVGMNESQLLSNQKQFNAVIEASKWLIANYRIPNVRGNAENLTAHKGIFGHYQTQGPWGNNQRGCNSPNKSDPGKTYMKKVWDTLGSSGTGC